MEAWKESLAAKGALHHDAVRRAVLKVDRARFIPDESRDQAAEDCPLPIGLGQTISQPSLVAHMTDLAAPAPEARVLEIGTGSGYQTALLAEIAREVYTIERHPELTARAETILRELGYTNIRFRTGDGHLGWPEAAPFDAIVATAAAATVPSALLEQLAPDGRLIIPVGPVDRTQDLLLVIRTDEEFEERNLGPVRFVPMVEN